MEEEEEESVQNGTSPPISPTKLAVEKKAADFDYLMGMAMWKLSTEDKDK